MKKFTVYLTLGIYAMISARDIAAKLKIALSDGQGSYLIAGRHLKNIVIQKWSVEMEEKTDADDEMQPFVFEGKFSFETSLSEKEINEKLMLDLGRGTSADGLKNKSGEVIAEISDYREWQLIEEVDFKFEENGE